MRSPRKVEFTLGDSCDAAGGVTQKVMQSYVDTTMDVAAVSTDWEILTEPPDLLLLIHNIPTKTVEFDHRTYLVPNSVFEACLASIKNPDPKLRMLMRYNAMLCAINKDVVKGSVISLP